MRFLVAVSAILIGIGNSSQETGVVYVIPLDGEVEKGLYHVFQRGFREAKSVEASYIIVDMDTPGGRVDVAWAICDLLLNSEIPTAVYVSGDATSAGAMIALAAEKIFMTQGSTIGTAAPIVIGTGGIEGSTVDQKAQSYVLAKFRSIAEARERDIDIAEAMVNPAKEVQRTNELGEIVIVSKEGELLTFTASEAVQWNVAEALVDDLDDVLLQLDLVDADVIRLHEAWFERLARFITSMTISGLLLTVGILGILMEVRTPGFGVPGILGITCVALFFWGHSIANLAGWEGPLLFLIGLALLSVEFFVTPGFGVLGAAGVVAMVASFVIALIGRSPVPVSPSFIPSLDWGSIMGALTITLVSTGIAIVGFMATPFLLPAVSKTGLGRRLLLATAVSRNDGYHSHVTETDLKGYVGTRGVAYTTLRPAGMAMFGDRKVDVVSEGGFIQHNQPVEVVRIEGRRIVVKPL